MLVEKYKMTYISKTARMYTAEQPAIPVETKIFGITTLSFGWFGRFILKKYYSSQKDLQNYTFVW